MAALTGEQRKVAKERERKKRVSEYNRAYAKANPEICRARNARYRAKNREKLAAAERERRAAMDPEERKTSAREEYLRNNATYVRYRKKKYAENAEEQKAAARDWARKNRARVQVRRHARRAAGEPDPEYVEILLNDTCAYCGGGMEHIDHIDAITRDGDNGWENLTAACATCNHRKYNHPLLRFMLQELERPMELAA